MRHMKIGADRIFLSKGKCLQGGHNGFPLSYITNALNPLVGNHGLSSDIVACKHQHF